MSNWHTLRATCLAYLKARDIDATLATIQRGTAPGVLHLMAIQAQHQRTHKSRNVHTSDIRQHISDIDAILRASRAFTARQN